jgi:hypothetical protein
MALFLHVLLAWDATMVRDDNGVQPWWLPAFFDGLVSFLVYIAMFLVTLAWLLVVAPIQHVVYAVLGAPARNAFRNKQLPRSIRSVTGRPSPRPSRRREPASRSATATSPSR